MTELPPPGLPIEEILPPKKATIPLSDKLGRSCSPLVKIGETVSRGEKIGEDSDNLMPSLHAPISGKVMDIRELKYSADGTILSLVLEADGQQSWKSDLISIENYLDSPSTALMQSIRDAGVEVVPSEALQDIKRAGNTLMPIKGFVINGIGQGFAGTIARQLLVERSGELLEGINLIKKLLQPDMVYLAVDEKHEDAIQALMDSGLEKDLELVKLDVYYPLGHPHLLFREIFNKEIPSPHGKAIDLGVAIVGVDTVLHALEAIKGGKPMTDRYLSVSGEGIQAPKNLKVPIGTPLGDIIEFCGGFKGRPGRMVLGNPLCGSAQFSLDSPVLKDTPWLWVQPEESVVTDKYRACINCGDCVDICPVRVMPNFLGKLCEFGKYEEAANRYDLFTCIECGLCTYVCPSRRPMVHFIKFGKWELSLKEKQNASD